MSIVCGTDFSQNAAEAEVAAAALAKHLGTDLKLVHVLDTRRQVSSSTALSLLLEPAEGLLAARAKRLEQDFRIEASPVLLQGAADECLNAFARERNARLLVVSALGAREQDGWRIGSIAERVVQRSGTPVLVVRDAACIVDWLLGKAKFNVMVGVDMGETSRAALRWAQALRQIAACDLTIARVAWPVLEHTRLGVSGPVLLEGMRDELRELLERDLRAWAGPIAGQGDTKLVIIPGWGRCDAHLAQLAEKAKVDLLVVGTHQKSWAARAWQGSVSRSVIHAAPSNVACVPRESDHDASASIAQFRSVLIPSDLSPLANPAIAAGYGLLRPGGEAHLVHVRLPEDQEYDESDLTLRLRASIPERSADQGITTHVHIVSDGDAATGITRLAARLGVDVICMSTHARSGVADLVLGSQAREVVRNAERPVLLVKAARE
ncbi:MAG: universal stress protein [Myxococcales bacterium]